MLMKKILVLMAIIVQSICAMADTVVEKIYYGTEARNSKKNPCKGECIYVCGKVTTKYVAVVPGIVAVTEVMTDGKGNIIYQESYTQEFFEVEAIADLVGNSVEENVTITVDTDD